MVKLITTVVCIRHGKPVSGGDDASRHLTPEGIEAQKKLAYRLEKKGYFPDIIFTSPILRAVESAQAVAEVCPAPIAFEPSLGVSFDGEHLLSIIEAHPGQTLFFIGHAPTLAQFVNDLVGKEVLKGLSKSEAAVITINEKVSFVGRF